MMLSEKNAPMDTNEETKEVREKKLEKFEALEVHLQEIGTHTSVVLELIVAVLVFVAIIVGVIHLVPELGTFIVSGGSSESLLEFLEAVFSVVIGIEFLKMLCKPTSANVLETIIFLVARHMILTVSSPLEDLLSVIAIVILILAKRYLAMTHNRVYHPELFKKKNKKNE